MTAPLWWHRAALGDVPDGDEWLAPAERDRQAGLTVAIRRRDWRLRRWVAKEALARVPGGPAGVGPAGIDVGNEPGGSPVARVGGRRVPMAVSLSDRAGVALCALAPEGTGLGCDVELVEPRSDAFVDQWLTEAEQALVATAAAGAGVGVGGRALAANLVWSAKESALKVVGEGLRRPARSVEVTVDPGAAPPAPAWAPLHADLAEGGRLTGWWRPLGDHVLTVLTDTPTAPPVEL